MNDVCVEGSTVCGVASGTKATSYTGLNWGPDIRNKLIMKYTHTYTDTHAEHDTLAHTVSLDIRILSAWFYFMQCFASCSAVMSRLRNGAFEQFCGFGKVNTNRTFWVGGLIFINLFIFWCSVCSYQGNHQRRTCHCPKSEWSIWEEPSFRPYPNSRSAPANTQRMNNA